MSDPDAINTDISAERAVLSCILKNNLEAFIKTEDICLQPSDFYYDTNSAIYLAMRNFYEKKPQGVIDKFSIIAEIKKMGDKRTLSIVEKKDCEYLDALGLMNVGLDALDEIAYSVKKNAVFRAVFDGIDEMKDSIENEINPSFTLEELMSIVERKYSGLTEGIMNPNAKFQTFGDAIDDWFDDKINNPRDLAGVPTGFPIYDYAIGRGLRRGSINMLGARTGVGKSLLSLNFGSNISNFKIPTLYIDTELEKEHQMSRLAAARANVGIAEIETGKIARDPVKLAGVKKEVAKIKKLPFYHQYVGGWRFEEILTYMKKWVRQCVGENEDGSLKDCVIIFDYLKMMKTDGLDSLKEYQLIGFWMTALHDFAIRYDVPIFLLIQLNRDGIQNEGQGLAAQSDRTEWLASSFTIFKNKTIEERTESGQHGNAKMIVVKSRFGPATPEGDYINVFANKSRALLIEGQMNSVARREDESSNSSEQEEPEQRQADDSENPW